MDNSPKIVEAHSVSNQMNNPPITQQLMKGVDLRGNEHDGQKIPLVFEEDIDIELDVWYFDSKLNKSVKPVRIYDGKIEVNWGAACPLSYWEKYCTKEQR